jgi:putative membrane protein
MKHALGRTLFAVVAFAMGYGLQAADGKDGRKLSGSDRQFVTQAAEDSVAEIELGKLAQRNGASAAVKDFGRRMVTEHGKANEELTAVASKLGIAPPRRPGSKHEVDMKKFARLKGADFDREYAEQMVKEHEKSVSLFEKEARTGDSPGLKAYAIKTLPVLQEHLKIAKALQSDMKK